MRIVEINTVCDTGSTGRIAAGVARIAADRGHEVWFAYGRGKHPSDLKGYKIGNRLDFYCHVLLNFIKGKSGFGSKTVTKRFLRWLDEIKPDILHLHNLHGFYIHVGMLFDYIKENDIKVVWTLHDCWPFTGQCAHFDYICCDKWISECHECPIYRSEYPYSIFCDNSKENYKNKKEAFTGVKDLMIVTPSMWLSELVKRSFLAGYKVQVINNGIDLDRFTKKTADNRDLLELRTKYSISADKTIILGVANIWTKRKGLDDFCKLATVISEDYLIVLVGVRENQKIKLELKYKGKILCIGHTNSIEELACWYRLADVFVNPTLEDNFPTTNIEALACGTSVVTYNTGGSPEIADYTCGRVVKKGDVTSLADAIVDVINNPIAPDSCRKRAQEYDKSDKLLQYVKLMETLPE